MAEAALHIFISYSRTDSDFADRLQADLLARNFDAWVDRHEIVGSQNWQDEIEKAIQTCDVMLMILSPKALESEYVIEEYRYAKTLKRRILPLHYKTIQVGPMGINDIQWVDFRNERAYGASLDELLRALALIIPRPVPIARVEVPSISSIKEESYPGDIVTVRPAPAVPAPDLLQLFQAGLEAKGNGDLDRTAIFWQQVIDRDRNFNGGTLQGQMVELHRELLPIRIQRLRKQAIEAAKEGDFRKAVGAWQALLELDPASTEAQQGIIDSLRQRALAARRRGQWGEEIGAWEAMRTFDPGNPIIAERIQIAMQNQRGDILYASARDFAASGKIAALRETVNQLWIIAPYYVDYDGIIQQAGISLPPDYDVVRPQQLRTEAKKAAIEGRWDDEIRAWKMLLVILPTDTEAHERLLIAQQNKQNEREYEDIRSGWASSHERNKRLIALWRNAPHYGDPKGLKAQIQRQAQREMEQQAQRQGEEKRRADRALAAKRAEERRQNAYSPPGSLSALGLFSLGAGGITLLLTQSGIWGIVGTGIAALIMYGLAYRRSIGLLLFLTILAVAAGCIVGIARLASVGFFSNVISANLSHPVTSHFWWFWGSKTLYLGRQINFGLILGLIAGGVDTGVGLGLQFDNHSQDAVSDRFAESVWVCAGAALLGTVVCWIIGATIAFFSTGVSVSGKAGPLPSC
jgi:tetratricopeptide (TPR) repeat protein